VVPIHFEEGEENVDFIGKRAIRIRGLLSLFFHLWSYFINLILKTLEAISSIIVVIWRLPCDKFEVMLHSKSSNITFDF